MHRITFIYICPLLQWRSWSLAICSKISFPASPLFNFLQNLDWGNYGYSCYYLISHFCITRGKWSTRSYLNPWYLFQRNIFLFISLLFSCCKSTKSLNCLICSYSGKRIVFCWVKYSMLHSLCWRWGIDFLLMIFALGVYITAESFFFFLELNTSQMDSRWPLMD